MVDLAAATMLDDAAGLRRFVARCSLETTLPEAAEIVSFAGMALPRMEVFLTALATKPVERQLECAIRLSEAGFEPVPHVAARGLRDLDEAREVIGRAACLAGVRQLLVVAGDRERPLGSLPDALSLIQSGILQEAGIRRVFLPGYPEGHPKIAPTVLAEALAAKLDALADAGIAAEIVTQFCFDAGRILDWLGWLRQRGIDRPVRIGIAGPAGTGALFRLALRCGVNAAWRGMTLLGDRRLQLADSALADALLRDLARGAEAGGLGPVAPHFFAFGGLVPTARWIRAHQSGT